jgi:hypothetical protein
MAPETPPNKPRARWWLPSQSGTRWVRVAGDVSPASHETFFAPAALSAIIEQLPMAIDRVRWSCRERRGPSRARHGRDVAGKSYQVVSGRGTA